MSFYKWNDDDLHLFLRVQPKASKNEFAEIIEDPLGDRIKLRITAPPVDGKANKHLIKHLATVFKTPKSNIIIKSGKTGRNKNIICLHQLKIIQRHYNHSSKPLFNILVLTFNSGMKRI